MALKKALPEENLALKKALPEENLALKITYRKGIWLSNIITGREAGFQILLPERILALMVLLILTDFLLWVVSFRQLPLFYTFPFNCP